MDNPLDQAGNLAKDAGEYASQGLFGIARFLEQLTGDATSAAIFAGFLVFALSILKVIAGTKHTDLYSKGLIGIGFIGTFGAIILGSFGAYSLAVKQSVVSTPGMRIQYKVFTNRIWGDFYYDEFFSEFSNLIVSMKWYLMVFLVIFMLGVAMKLFIKTNQNISNMEQV